MAPALGSAPVMMAFMIWFLGRAADDEDQLLFVGKLHPHEVRRALHAGALGVDDGATAGPLGAGCVHDGAGVALIGDDEQQLIAGIFQGALLL